MLYIDDTTSLPKSLISSRIHLMITCSTREQNLVSCLFNLIAVWQFVGWLILWQYMGSGRGGLPPPPSSVESARRCLCLKWAERTNCIRSGPDVMSVADCVYRGRACLCAADHWCVWDRCGVYRSGVAEHRSRYCPGSIESKIQGCFGVRSSARASSLKSL